MAIKVLALDLERTLISDAMNREPRPGLRPFLEFCLAAFPRLALYTAVREPHARAVVAELIAQGDAPAALSETLEIVTWHGNYKDLRFIRDALPVEVVLVDDDAGFILPEQRAQWIAIAEFDPYLVRGEDQELARVQSLLQERLRQEA